VTLKKRQIYFLIGVVLIINGIVLTYIDSATLKTGWINPFLPILIILVGLALLFMSKPLPRVPKLRG